MPQIREPLLPAPVRMPVRVPHGAGRFGASAGSGSRGAGSASCARTGRRAWTAAGTAKTIALLFSSCLLAFGSASGGPNASPRSSGGLAVAPLGQGASAVSRATEAEILRLEDRREYGTALVRLLISSEPAVRERAAVAAGRIGDPRAIAPLAALLRDTEPRVRREAAFALGEMEDSAAVTPLALLLSSQAERDEEVRALAIEALGKLQAIGEAPSCVAALRDRSPAVRVAAAYAVWKLRAADAVAPLIESSRAGDPEERAAACYALMRMLGAPPSGRTPVPGAAALDSTATAGAIAALCDRISDPDPFIRLSAARGLSRAPGAATLALAALGALEKARDDPDWRVRVEALRSLDAMASPPPSPSQSPAPSPATAPSASPASLFAAALAALEDPNPNVRITAIEALERAGSEDEVLSRLRRVLEGSPSEREREVAALAIAGRLEEAGAPPASVAALARKLAADRSWRLRAAAADLLARRDAAAGRAAPGLVDSLWKDDPRVAKNAIPALLALRIPADAPPAGRLEAMRVTLDRALASPDPVIPAVAIEAARAALGDSLPPDARDAWIAFLAAAWEGTPPAGEDRALAILSALEPYASASAPALRIVRDAAAPDAAPAFQDEIVRREARRILRAAGEDVGPEPPIETGRSPAEYGRIAAWAEQEHAIEIRTGGGTIEIRLFPHEAPLTCWNFVRLAESGYFDGSAWHRVVPDFVVQDGDPRGDGFGGPGYRIRCEIHKDRRYGTGSLGMALSGKDTGGSQFFLTHSPQPHLDGRYTVFGQVVSGQELVDRVAQGDRIDSIRAVSAVR